MSTFIPCTNMLLKRNTLTIDQNILPLTNTSSHVYKVIATLKKSKKNWQRETKEIQMRLSSALLNPTSLLFKTTPKRKPHFLLSFPIALGILKLLNQNKGSFASFLHPPLLKTNSTFRRQINLHVCPKIWLAHLLKSPIEKKSPLFALCRGLYSHKRHGGEANIWTSSMAACRLAI